MVPAPRSDVRGALTPWMSDAGEARSAGEKQLTEYGFAVDSARLVEGVAAAIAIATLTAPVGVSGAVFLLPVQLDVLHVPNPAVTPTNLLYNVIAAPGALLRYRDRLAGPLTRTLLIGTVPGVIAGAASAWSVWRARRVSAW